MTEVELSSPERMDRMLGCDGRASWERRYKPALLRSGLSVDPQTSADAGAKGAGERCYCVLQCIEAFEGMRQLAGDAVVLAAMAEEPEWIRDMSRTYTDLILQDFQAVLERM
jgi:hypothetical protein